MLEDDIPLKRCPTCPEPEENHWHPATTEFWHRDKNKEYGLATICKECRSKKAKADRNNPEKREDILAKRRAYYHSPEAHERIRTRVNEHNHIPEIREKNHARDLAYRSRPEIREHRRLRMKGYNKRSDVRQRNRIRSKKIYHDPAMHGQIRMYHNTYDKVYRRRPDVHEKNQARQRIYYSRPQVRERRRGWHRAYYHRPDVHERERTRQNAYYGEYYSHPEVKIKKKIDVLARLCRKKSVPGTHTAAQIAEQLRRQRYHCYYATCGYAKLKRDKTKAFGYDCHIEHTYPLSRVAGTNIPANDMGYLVLACPSCNLKKGNKYPWEFPEGGRLL